MKIEDGSNMICLIIYFQLAIQLRAKILIQYNIVCRILRQMTT